MKSFHSAVDIVKTYQHLYIPGPTNVPHEILSAIDGPMEDHRSPDHPLLTLPLFEDLKKIFKTESGHVLLLPGSGTAGWEAALQNTLSPGDRVLAASYGQFSQMWIDMCVALGLDVTRVETEWGEGVPLGQFEQILSGDSGHTIRAVLVTHNETATGVTSDVGAVRRILDHTQHPALLYADGVSSIASIDFRMDEWGIDLAVAGSQKGFMLPAGMGIVGVSQKALDAGSRATLPRYYFDFQRMLTANQKGYFPYTPSVPLLRGLRVSVDRLLEEGLEAVFARHHRLAEGVRRAVKEGWGLRTVARSKELNSDTVTAILLPEGADAARVISTAYQKYNLSLGTGLGQLAGKVFRIGHLGSLNELMLLGGICGTEMALLDNGIEITPGSGAAAASEYWRSTAG